jgi:hypothetical protein
MPDGGVMIVHLRKLRSDQFVFILKRYSIKLSRFSSTDLWTARGKSVYG